MKISKSGRRFSIFSIVLATAVFVLIGCKNEERSTHARGFHLPNGDPDIGQELFVSMKCHLCHTVAGTELPDYKIPALQRIEIGGKVQRVRSYGELVTSIISPEHVVSEKWLAVFSKEERKKGEVFSPMPVFNDQMTVQQLVDLAAFLFVAFEENDHHLYEYYPVMP